MILPEDLREKLRNEPRRDTLLEVVVDLGRPPEARFLGDYGGQYLRSTEVSEQDLEFAQNAIGEFGGDNRAGIEGTLHRISAIRSRKGLIVGLTCRIGRSVTGHVDMVRDLLQYKESILFLGRPGVGKTTVMREIACVLADEFHKRVVIVDTSNEIGGDGDIPHAAIGSARRMQVPKPTMQHKVMIEAVENHMPEVIIVDEIGTEAEALACQSIAERGVMLLGTAHGERIENIIKNPTLSDMDTGMLGAKPSNLPMNPRLHLHDDQLELVDSRSYRSLIGKLLYVTVGGVQTVTLGDEEARARGSQKSVLERKAPPTFPFLIEMRERDYWVVHRTDRSVDALLRGGRPLVEVKKRDKNFKVVTERWVQYDGDGI
ncbi:uncharacterized protein ycf45 isoform X4 [Nymphaea colorata]|uniref:uncharacterized protein ycf45 isoform X4 n=1 Tax=Nymphaea colorata TaxID=210225 RepID=UPI00129D352B|nr:uncharacterized protein ycf45 isoform X4 [Nymphaea colorata]XP_031490744.1 uncharacterized protein ycf45 isoform X4 [Nymphaea colorata]XP_031490745.1 uncharacterized protein ycf45 isoform X4 [Nymphaea colorata]